MRALGWVVVMAAIAGIAVVGGLFTAQRTGSDLAGWVAGITFAAVFGAVLFRAIRGSKG